MGVVAGFMVPHPPLIVPSVGRGGEAQIEETTASYDRVAQMIADIQPETIVISSPHTVLYADYFHISPGAHASGSFASFGAPESKFDVDYDERLIAQIVVGAGAESLDAGILGERDASLDHGTMVPLYFINKYYTDYKLVRIGLSGFSLATHYRMGQTIAKAADELDRKVVYVASGDLSHKLKEDGSYGFDPSGPVYDDRIMDVMGRGAFDELMDFDETLLNSCAECGHRSFVMMAGSLDGKKLDIQRLSHQDVTGVGYGICTYKVVGESDTHYLDIWTERNNSRLSAARSASDPYVRLARRSLESFIRSKKTISWQEEKESIFSSYIEDNPDLKNDIKNNLDNTDLKTISKISEELSNTRAGAFVSIHKEGKLRGCIGTISATRDCLADEIIENAISASTKDPRFYPITEDELPLLEISVDVLSDAEPIDSSGKLDVKKYGVIVTKGMKRGLLLPNLDGVDTVEEQISIAKQKAGIPEYEEDYSLERFEVVRHY